MFAHRASNGDTSDHAPHDRLDDEALAALPDGTGPGALGRRSPTTTTRGLRERRLRMPRTPTTGDRGVFVSLARRVPIWETSTVKIGIVGADRLGRAVELQASRGHHAVLILGRPLDGRHLRGLLREMEVLVHASDAISVLPDLRKALEAGCRRIVIAAESCDPVIPLVDSVLVENTAAAVAADSANLGFIELGYRIPQSRSGSSRSTTTPGATDLSRACQRTRPLGADRDQAVAVGILASAEWLVREPRAPGLHLVHSIADDVACHGGFTQAARRPTCVSAS